MTSLSNEIGRRLAVIRLQTSGRLLRQPAPSQRVTVMGLDFRNPLGVAAGFDRKGVLLPLLEAAGFGFMEVGTVTCEHAHEIAARLAAAPANDYRVAVNIGSLRPGFDRGVADDYRACLRGLAPVADILVANLSCRRMARLRGTNAVGVATFLAVLREEADLLADRLGRRVRLAIKLDMAEPESAMAVEAAVAARLDGLVAVGGDIAAVVARANPLAVIAVGDIGRAADVTERLTQGAALVEVYTALVHGGASVPRRLLRPIGGYVRG